MLVATGHKGATETATRNEEANMRSPGCLPAGADRYPLLPRFTPAASQAGVDLYWLPLGAGGWFVKMNGRIWEAVQARRERRRPLDLYHTALVVRVPEGRFVVENCWPIPNADGPSRGVLVEGPVACRSLGAGGCSATRCAVGRRG